MSHDGQRAARDLSRKPGAVDRRFGAPWLAARSAGEILALAALLVSAVALVVVLDDADAPGSLREQIGTLLIRLEGQANAATVVMAGVALALAVGLALVIRARDLANVRADRLARELTRARLQSERLKSTLAARDEQLLAVVHELRTPLTHVVGYAELLSSGARPRHPEEIGEMSAAIQSASSTMLRLMDDLAEATRVQATEGFGLKSRPVDLGHLIRGIVSGFEVQTKSHRLEVDLPDHWLAVIGDPERIHQVLANLLANAIAYSPVGGEIRVRARSAGAHVRVDVEDRGIGLAPEDQRRVFDRFYRTSAGRALRHQGSGLGLAIVKELVQAHGGQVGVISKPGAGSTFWFTLPSADDRAGTPEPFPVTAQTVQVAPTH